jgi:hypothetical protein
MLNKRVLCEDVLLNVQQVNMQIIQLENVYLNVLIFLPKLMEILQIECVLIDARITITEIK